jgi:hypothetical protein
MSEPELATTSTPAIPSTPTSMRLARWLIVVVIAVVLVGVDAH